MLGGVFGSCGGTGNGEGQVYITFIKKKRQRKGEGVAQWQSDCRVCVSQYPRLKPQFTHQKESPFTHRTHWVVSVEVCVVSLSEPHEELCAS